MNGTPGKPAEPGAREPGPAERIEHDAGLSPGAIQSGAAAGAAIGGRRGSEVPREPPEKDIE